MHLKPRKHYKSKLTALMVTTMKTIHHRNGVGQNSCGLWLDFLIGVVKRAGCKRYGWRSHGKIYILNTLCAGVAISKTEEIYENIVEKLCGKIFKFSVKQTFQKKLDWFQVQERHWLISSFLLKPTSWRHPQFIFSIQSNEHRRQSSRTNVSFGM